MKLIFSYLNLGRNTGNFHHDSFKQGIIEGTNDENYSVRYNTMLCGYIREFDSLDVMAWVFDGISKVERNISSTEERSSNHFQAIYKRDSVTINFLLTDDNDPNWPTEIFPLTEVKSALEGWKKFLEMPESFDSVVEVEL